MEAGQDRTKRLPTFHSLHQRCVAVTVDMLLLLLEPTMSVQQHSSRVALKEQFIILVVQFIAFQFQFEFGSELEMGLGLGLGLGFLAL